ncbi:hypothetical protein BCR37DRAFT_392537 [Protomyces lactucae-debilis]|uniref:Uncharacterized protein n=1 Tax=Protomyces lactucae-debilis TaxID=2754530 RepID=A0A1Y2FGZ0_PROLT|nr:uncharacterized protein BCR37DRAFT_392537 [Protomyces lactucae-debilis]ORY83193.1 hypothetical protein BCR37DRAFT_392537 [Protomyces lactucae-debilis]
MDSTSTGRRILPLPKRRVASLSSASLAEHGTSQHRQGQGEEEALAVTAATGRPPLFSRALHQGMGLIHQQHGGRHDAASEGDSEDDEGGAARAGGDEEQEQDEEEDEDECSGCRDWLDNVKNKKKRKIPTSAVMGHSSSHAGSTATAVPFASTLGQGLHMARQRASLSVKQHQQQQQQMLSRRRRTWDVSTAAAAGEGLGPGGSRSLDKTTTTTAPDISLPSKPFDFSCDSPIARNLPTAAPEHIPAQAQQPISVATQTTPSLADSSPVVMPLRPNKTPSEKSEDRVRLVRRQRRELKAKLKPGETPPLWICQFCEFESIFGYAPLALIDGYNERMRSARRAAQERARLLEKARSKGKKKKKKAAATTPSSSATPAATATDGHGAATTAPIAKPGLPPTLEPPQVSIIKKGIDKGIGPTHSGCTCCGGYRQAQETHTRPPPPPIRDRMAAPPPTTQLPPIPGQAKQAASVPMQREEAVSPETFTTGEPIVC